MKFRDKIALEIFKIKTSNITTASVKKMIELGDINESQKIQDVLAEDSYKFADAMLKARGESYYVSNSPTPELHGEPTNFYINNEELKPDTVKRNLSLTEHESQDIFFAYDRLRNIQFECGLESTALPEILATVLMVSKDIIIKAINKHIAQHP